MHEQRKIREASEWWLRLQEDAALEHGREWLAWSQDNAENLDAFDKVHSLASQLRHLSPVDRAELAGEFAPSSARFSYRRMQLSLAVGLIAIVAGVIFFVLQSRHTIYTTDRAMHQEVTLIDGSLLAVGASSKVSIQMRRDERRINLRDGEAYFEVQRDAKRPFIVDAGDVTITAIGTAFDVRRTGRKVSVSVTDGRVRVVRKAIRDSGLNLSAGERISYTPAEEFKISTVTAERAVGWRARRLEFVNEPLDVVIANVNRYSNTPVTVADAAAARLTFTGTVLPDNLPGWLNALPSVLPVRVARSSDELRIESASKP